MIKSFKKFSELSQDSSSLNEYIVENNELVLEREFKMKKIQLKNAVAFVGKAPKLVGPKVKSDMNYDVKKDSGYFQNTKRK